MTKLKVLAKETLLALGLDVRFKREPLAFLQAMGIKTVLDIGANQGQFANRVRGVLPEAKIYSFEPLLAPFRTLVQSRRHDNNFRAFQIALGAEAGEADFEMNDFSGASSMLKTSARSKASFPFTATSSSIKVAVATLDDWCSTQSLDMPLFVKMDVHGFEDRVIHGGSQTLSRAKVVLTEVSFTALYENQPLFEDIYQLMQSLGFRCGGVIDMLTDNHTGEILQADALFVQRETSAGGSHA